MNIEEWVAMVEAKMARGREEYGDGSFMRPPSEIVAELTEEAVDLAGWGFVLWRIKHGVGLGNPLQGLRAFIRDSYHTSAWPPPDRQEANRFALWAGSMGARVAEQADWLRREGEG